MIYDLEQVWPAIGKAPNGIPDTSVAYGTTLGTYQSASYGIDDHQIVRIYHSENVPILTTTLLTASNINRGFALGAGRVAMVMAITAQVADATEALFAMTQASLLAFF